MSARAFCLTLLRKVLISAAMIGASVAASHSARFCSAFGSFMM